MIDTTGIGGCVVRQSRSEATRRKIIDAAVEVFDEEGYPATGLGDIIERVEVTKGALYHHFESKESLALAIVEEAVRRTHAAFRQVSASSSALESMVQGVFVAAELAAADRLVRTGGELLYTFAKFHSVAAGYYRGWLDAMTELAARAQADGDLRSDLDPRVVSEIVVSALVGAEVISASLSRGTDVVTRARRVWEFLLPALVSEGSQPYFAQFVARQAKRHQVVAKPD